MTPDIRFLVFDHIRHVRQIRDHVRQFYSNCRTLFYGEKSYWKNDPWER